MIWYYWLLIMFGIFVLTLIMANRQSKGLLFRLMVIRSKPGSVLLLVRSKTNDYFKIAHKIEERILYKKRGSKDLTPLIIPPGANPFRHVVGVIFAEVNEETNALILDHGEAVPGFDAETWQKLYIRAMMDMGDKINWMLILWVVIGVGLAVVIVGGMVHHAQQGISANHQLLLNISSHFK